LLRLLERPNFCFRRRLLLLRFGFLSYARFKKDQRAIDGRKAMTEYEAQVLAIHAFKRAVFSRFFRDSFESFVIIISFSVRLFRHNPFHCDVD
jgi:hypothetical protein